MKRDDLLRQVLRWLAANIPQAALSACLGALFGYLVNVALMMFRYDGFEVPPGQPAVGKGNLIWGSLIWGVISTTLFGLFGYWRSVGTKRFFQDLKSLPSHLERLVRVDGPAARAHLLWGAAMSLMLMFVVSPWLGLLVAAGLLASLPSVLGRFVSGLALRVWSALLQKLSPAGKHRLVSPVSMAVGILGGSAAAILAFFLPSGSTRLVLAVACGLGAHFQSRRLLLWLPAALLVPEAMAHDGGWWEYGGTSWEGWLRSPGAATLLGVAAASVPASAAGAAFGTGLGNILGQSGWGDWYGEDGEVDYSREHQDELEDLLGEVGDPDLYDRLERLTDRVGQTGRIDPRELEAIRREQDRLVEERRRQIDEDNRQFADGYREEQRQRDEREVARQARQQERREQLDRQERAARQAISELEDPVKAQQLEDFLDRHRDDPEGRARAIAAVRAQTFEAGQQRQMGEQEQAAAEADAYRGSEEFTGEVRDWSMRANRTISKFLPGGQQIVAAQATIYGGIQGYDEGGLRGALGRTAANMADNYTEGGGTAVYETIRKGGGLDELGRRWGERVRTTYDPGEYVRRVREAGSLGELLDAGLDASDVASDLRDRVVGPDVDGPRRPDGEDSEPEPGEPPARTRVVSGDEPDGRTRVPGEATGAEVSPVDAPEARAEASPVDAPEGRTGAEASPVDAPEGRTGAEVSPVDAPEGRTGAEVGPIDAPEGRTGAEASPVDAPEGRTGDEVSPVNAPEGRIGAEVSPAEAPESTTRVSPLEAPEGGIRGEVSPADAPEVGTRGESNPPTRESGDLDLASGRRSSEGDAERQAWERRQAAERASGIAEMDATLAREKEAAARAAMEEARGDMVRGASEETVSDFRRARENLARAERDRQASEAAREQAHQEAEQAGQDFDRARAERLDRDPRRARERAIDQLNEARHEQADAEMARREAIRGLVRDPKDPEAKKVFSQADERLKQARAEQARAEESLARSRQRLGEHAAGEERSRQTIDSMIEGQFGAPAAGGRLTIHGDSAALGAERLRASERPQDVTVVLDPATRVEVAIDPSRSPQEQLDRAISQQVRLPTGRVPEGMMGFDRRGDSHALGVAGTAAHERVHAHTSDAFRNEHGSKVNLTEGLTEHYTRRVREQQGFTGRPQWERDGHYDQQTEVAGRLERVVGQQALEGAYFRGDTAALHQRLGQAMGQTDPVQAEASGKQALETLETHMKQAREAEAAALQARSPQVARSHQVEADQAWRKVNNMLSQLEQQP